MSLVQKVMNMKSSIRHGKTTVRNPRQSDLYIVEFPKSGITWLSCILANAALIHSNRREVASFVNSHVYIPDVHISRDVGEPAYEYPPVRMFKSHSEWNPNYKFVIYLARHPLSVMKSYYRYLVDRRIFSDMDFDTFCRSDKFGIPAWKRHVSSWLVGDDVPNRLHIITYEQLISNAVREIVILSTNFGWGFGEDMVEAAVRRADVKSMKDSELLYASRNPRHLHGFIRAGREVETSESTADWIRVECKSELMLLGYEQ